MIMVRLLILSRFCCVITSIVYIHEFDSRSLTNETQVFGALFACMDSRTKRGAMVPLLQQRYFAQRCYKSEFNSVHIKGIKMFRTFSL